MEEPYLYQKIAESIRQQILSGSLQPGDRLPSVRKMTAQWECTIGTVQRAYQELARQGLVVSRPGTGTKVVEQLPPDGDTPLRRAALIHRAEAFLLEMLTVGYKPAEMEQAFGQALERWRVIEHQPTVAEGQLLRFAGSHDFILTWLASHFGEIAPGDVLQLRFSGSLGGLISLSEGESDIAGCHLWDEETSTFNAPFVRRLLPGRRTALVTLARRRIGLIVPAGNPAGIQGLKDLKLPGLRFANRQPGSGTRVWLDAALRQAGLEGEEIKGYLDEKMTHTEVARAVAEGQVDAGIGLEAAAISFGLDFVPLTRERYDLAIPEAVMLRPAVRKLVAWLQSEAARAVIEDLGGYEAGDTGQVEWVG